MSGIYNSTTLHPLIPKGQSFLVGNCQSAVNDTQNTVMLILTLSTPAFFVFKVALKHQHYFQPRPSGLSLESNPGVS